MTNEDERVRDITRGVAELMGDDESGGELAHGRQRDDSLPDSISRNIQRGITPEQLKKEGRQ